MKPILRTRHALLSAALPGLLALLLAAPARANEVAAGGAPTSRDIVVHDAAETLRDWCHTDSRGVLWLVLPGGTSYELITSVSDPAVTNHGDGAFHAFDAGEVAGALAAVRYPLDGVSADVFILPYPRRAGLTSAAGPGLILLSPGVYPVPREQQHAEFVHELGHVVQYAHLPDQDAASWNRYRTLRGITDVSVYCDNAAHADRPHEIFAEDFRGLFGGPLANSTGNIENASLTPPTQIAGLADFMLQLSGTVADRHARRAPQSGARSGALLAEGLRGGGARPVRPRGPPSGHGRARGRRRRRALELGRAGRVRPPRRAGRGLRPRARRQRPCAPDPAALTPPRGLAPRLSPGYRPPNRSCSSKSSVMARACSSPKPAKLRAASNSE